jgi:hypothetical protein
MKQILADGDQLIRNITIAQANQGQNVFPLPPHFSYPAQSIILATQKGTPLPLNQTEIHKGRQFVYDPLRQTPHQETEGQIFDPDPNGVAGEVVHPEITQNPD